MKYNGELKSIDTQEKAYLLGQIYGDGFCGKSGGSYKTILGSNIGDVEIYKKLQELFPFFTLKTYKSHSNMIYLENNEKSLYLDLKNLGMLSNKTKNDATGDFHFPNIEENLISHFIRGYFDADGSFWYPKRHRSRNNLRTDFGCTTPNFLSEVRKVLDNKDIKFCYNSRVKKASNNKYYASYNLFSSNTELSRKFADYIYKDATIYLKYKYEVSHRELDIIKASEIFGNCPRCGSKNINKNGMRNGKHRLKCSNCSLNFTKPMPTQ